MASGDLTNTPLLRYVAEIGKPMIVSTGGGLLDDVRRAHETVAEINPQVAILQCTAGYPAEWDELDLKVIETYRECFPETVVGFSGHDNGISMPLVAYVLGAPDRREALHAQPRAGRAPTTSSRSSRRGCGSSSATSSAPTSRSATATKTMYPSEADPIRRWGR